MTASHNFPVYFNKLFGAFVFIKIGADKVLSVGAEFICGFIIVEKPENKIGKVNIFLVAEKESVLTVLNCFGNSACNLLGKRCL